jgi:hypothetical protein
MLETWSNHGLWSGLMILEQFFASCLGIFYHIRLGLLEEHRAALSHDRCA